MSRVCKELTTGSVELSCRVGKESYIRKGGPTRRTDDSVDGQPRVLLELFDRGRLNEGTFTRPGMGLTLAQAPCLVRRTLGASLS